MFEFRIYAETFAIRQVLLELGVAGISTTLRSCNGITFLLYLSGLELPQLLELRHHGHADLVTDLRYFELALSRAARVKIVAT